MRNGYGRVTAISCSDYGTAMIYIIVIKDPFINFYTIHTQLIKF